MREFLGVKLLRILTIVVVLQIYIRRTAHHLKNSILLHVNFKIKLWLPKKKKLTGKTNTDSPGTL